MSLRFIIYITVVNSWIPPPSRKKGGNTQLVKAIKCIKKDARVIGNQIFLTIEYYFLVIINAWKIGFFYGDTDIFLNYLKFLNMINTKHQPNSTFPVQNPQSYNQNTLLRIKPVPYNDLVVYPVHDVARTFYRWFNSYSNWYILI